ncbi:hypothetical protein SLS59_009676 [Nothophoma quercina]|uniref:Histone H4 n=1 Tax=Nothophoma quercina TaxID=749835 RepID=A0ABR3QKA1_9PLEO
MVNERPKQFGGMPRFGAGPRSGFTRPTPSSQTASPSASRATQLGIGLGKGAAGLGLGKGKGQKRHILKEVIAVVEHTGRKTVSVTDIIFILNRVSLSATDVCN